MPIKEILKAVVFLNRNVDGKDISETVNCIPDSRMKVLEDALIERQNAKEINTVQVGRYRMQAASFTEYTDEVDRFLEKLDSVRPASRFTGFDDVEEFNAEEECLSMPLPEEEQDSSL